MCLASSGGFLGPRRFRFFLSVLTKGPGYSERIDRIEEKLGRNELLSLVLFNSFSS